MQLKSAGGGFSYICRIRTRLRQKIFPTFFDGRKAAKLVPAGTALSSLPSNDYPGTGKKTTAKRRHSLPVIC
jgi:hypothetical protein